jgi:hypothetical protein
MRGTFREAFVIGTGVFLWGAAGGHMYEMIAEDNFSRNNAGNVLYLDILLPTANAALLWRLRVAEKRVPARAGTRLGTLTPAD